MIFIQEYVTSNVFCKMLAILSQPQWVNKYGTAVSILQTSFENAVSWKENVRILIQISLMITHEVLTDNESEYIFIHAYDIILLENYQHVEAW